MERVEFRERCVYNVYIYIERERKRKKEDRGYNKKKREKEFLVHGRHPIIHHRQTFVGIAGHASHTIIDEHVQRAYIRVYDRGRK